MNSLDWKPISQDPPVKHGWFAVAVLPQDHQNLSLEQINKWRFHHGFEKAWFNADDPVDPWTVDEFFTNGRITHWAELPKVPTLTEKPE